MTEIQEKELTTTLTNLQKTLIDLRQSHKLDSLSDSDKNQVDKIIEKISYLTNDSQNHLSKNEMISFIYQIVVNISNLLIH